MKIGFLSNQIDARGTGNAMYNYAHYNEEILENKSKIFTLQNNRHSPEAFQKFVNRFGNVYLPTDENLRDIDALYHIKSGENDGFSTDCPYLVHGVFNAEVHGTRYAVVSEWMGIRNNLPFVPHIVTLADHTNDFRNALNIPVEAIVFGRHGGYDTFDIPWVWDAIKEVLDYKPNVYFLFMNTHPEIDHPRVLHFSLTLNEDYKRVFLNTCNAMLHARARGETFGISVGEFSCLGKPIFTFRNSPEKAHIYELKGTAKTYENKDQLLVQLLSYDGGNSHPFYQYTPEKVMDIFKEVFLA